MTLSDTLTEYTHATDPREYAQLEIALLDELGLPYEHVPDTETQDYDAILTRSVHPAEYDLPGSQIVFPPNTPIEIKTCHEWITDRHAHNNRRRGRFYITPIVHRRFKGAYLLAVFSEDNTTIIHAALIDHAHLDSIILGSTTSRGVGRCDASQIPWTSVLQSTRG